MGVRPAMTKPFWVVALVGLLLVGVGLAGCHAPADDDDTTTPPPPPPAVREDPPTFTYQATDYAFSGPTELPAGWVHLVLEHRAMEPHHIQLWRLEDGHTMAELLAVLEETHMPPEWAVAVGGPNPPVFGAASDAYVHLEPGEHAMLCMIPDGQGVPHFMLGMALAVTVVADENEAEPPAATLTVGLQDFAFRYDSLPAGEHLVAAVNEGGQPHELVAVRFHEGGNFSGFFAAFGPNATGPPPADFMGGVSAIMPGDRQLFPLTLTPGRYGFICFIEDPATGAPHFALGMMEEFEVV